MKIEIVNYKKEYSKILNKIDSDQWGNYENEVIEDYLTEDRCFKVALFDNYPVGFAFGKIIKDSFEIETICIHKDYWHKGIGTLLLTFLLNFAKDKGIKKSFSYLVRANNHTNSAKLFRNAGFRHIKDIKNFWGNLDPNYYCPECNSKPCICTAEYWAKSN